MFLSSLLAAISSSALVSEDIDIQSITDNSKNVKPGALFVAVPCAAEEAHIQEALEKGAVYIVRQGEGAADARTLYVPNARLALAHLCSHFFTQRPKKIVAVTGTNGKSSVVHIVNQLLHLTGITAASLGTLGVQIAGQPDVHIDAPALTSYDSVNLHTILQTLAQNHVQCAAIEATSHGLDQYRLDGVQFDAVGLTNITQDHLDYHHTMEVYAQAKSRLFSVLAKPHTYAVLNKKVAFGEQILRACALKGLKVWTFGRDTEADLTASDIQLYPDHSTATLTYKGKKYPILLPLPGAFQIENVLCAIGLILGAYPQIQFADLLPFIARLQPVPGRFEPVAQYHGGQIFVDFGHTPDALEQTLHSLRQLHPKRLCVVFGCGGNRDPGKRAQMGRVAAQLADHVIITDDNPRDEDPKHIRAAILEGAPNAQEIANRTKAIQQGIAELSKDDILLIAGRGHEQFQTIAGGVKVPNNDKETVCKIIQANNLPV